MKLVDCNLRIATFVLASMSGPLFAADAAFPTKAIRFILGYPPGGASDAVARVIGAPLSARLGQQVVVDNRPGAGGNIAGEITARAAPDGHTWMLGNNAILATNQALYSRMPFDSVRDFATVGLVGSQPSVLVVHPSLPVKTARDLVMLAKARPGELNYASTGTGTAGHLIGELFKGFEATNWHGIVAPIKTPDAVVTRINSELNAVLALPETRDRLSAQGIEPRGGTPAEFASYLRSEIPKWTKVVRESGAKAD